MFAPTAYLRWAIANYGSVPFNLGSSGIAGADMPALAVPRDLYSMAAWDTLRARVAAYNGVPAGEAIPAMGTTHALWVAYASLVAPGDEVLVERPTYEPLHRIAEGTGARVAWFDRPAGRGYAVDPDAVGRAMTDRTRVVALANLHNPSGVRASDEAIREVARVAAARGAHVLVDEVYAPFDDLSDARGVWGASARRLAPNVVAVGSLTKGYGLGAHRVGWVLGPRDVIARCDDALLASLGHAPTPWTAFAVAAFDELATFAAWSRGVFAGKRAKVEAWVAARPHLAWSAPREGLFGFAIDTRTREDLTARIERGIAERGVIVAPGAFFGVPNGFRLAWAIEGAKMDEALERLGGVIG
jgi:aspartate/methionine/tyrosine aminotransferase